MANGITTLEEQNEALNQGVGGSLSFTRDPSQDARNNAVRNRVEAIKSSAEGQAMRAFILSNTNGQQTPNAREQLRHYYEAMENITLPTGQPYQDRLMWTAFKEIGTQALVEAGNQETFNQFVQRVSYEAPVQGKIEGEPEQKPAVVEEVQKSVNEADQYAERFLASIQTAFYTSHSKWLSRHEDAKDNRGLQLPYAQQMFSAVEYAFGGGSSRGGNKKWKELVTFLYKKNPRLFGDKLQQAIQTTGGSIPKAIDAEIMQSKANNEEPSTIFHLREVVKSKDREIRDIVEEHVLQCAKLLSRPREGDSLSLDYGTSDITNLSNIVADDTAVPPDAIEPSMSDNELRAANTAWDSFIANPNNAQIIQQIRQMKHGRDDAGQPMLPLLVQRMKTEEYDLIKQAIHTAFVGWSQDGTQKWMEFFKRYPQFTQGQNGSGLLNQISAIASGQADGLQQLQQFVLRSAYDFFVKNFEERGLDLSDQLSQIAPGVGNLKSFQRVNQLVSKYFLRHYDYLKRRGLDSAKESARRYALMKAKGDALILKFQQLGETHEPLWLTKDVQLVRSKNSDSFVLRRRSLIPGTRKETWTENIVQDNDFPLLQGIISNEEWVPRAIEIMQERFPTENVLKRDEKRRGDNPLQSEADAATEQYKQQNPDEQDRLKGFRIFMGQKIRQIREQKGMTPEQVAEAMRGPAKAGRPSGARISQDPIGMIERFEAGVAQRYAIADLEKLAAGLGVPLESFYTRPIEYDPLSINDCTDLHSQVGQSFRVYGGYLLRRKKEAIRRGIRNDFFSQRMMYFYLSTMQVHNLFSSKPGGKKRKNEQGVWETVNDGSIKDSDQKVGKILYQLVGKPVGLGISMEEIRDNLGDVPTEDVNTPGPPGGRSVPDFRGPRTFTDPETGRRSPLPSDVVQRFYVDEDIAADPWEPGMEGRDPAFLGPDEQPQHPDDIRRRFYQPDADQWRAAIERIPYKDGVPHSLDFYIKETTKKMEENAASRAPEAIRDGLGRMGPVPLAKQIIRKIWPSRMVDGQSIPMDEATIQHMLQRKMEAANRFNERHNKPERFNTIDEFARKFVADEIKISRYFRDQAQALLQRISGGADNMDTLDKIRTFVPASVRRQVALRHGKPGADKNEGTMPTVFLKPVLDPATGLEKYDASQLTHIVLAAMDELDRIGDLYERASQFTDIPSSLEAMLERTANSAVFALSKFS